LVKGTKQGRISLIQRLTAHYFKSPVQPITDGISGVVIWI